MKKLPLILLSLLNSCIAHTMWRFMGRSIQLRQRFGPLGVLQPTRRNISTKLTPKNTTNTGNTMTATSLKVAGGAALLYGCSPTTQNSAHPIRF